VLVPKEGSADAQDLGKQKAYLDRTFAEAREIRESKSVECPVHFMGIWDTVSSLGWAYDPKTFPNTAKMPQVKVIRHAMALDERRAKFRPNRVIPVPQAAQDIEEIWFSRITPTSVVVIVTIKARSQKSALHGFCGKHVCRA
jgi:uncharacterized protein (DUF2235 family)